MDAVKRRMVQDRKNELRRNYRQSCREANLIKEYVRTKYVDVYKEACAFYNYLNSMYPTKPDLRKTDEFKALVKGYTFVARNEETVVTEPIQVYRPISELGVQNFTVHRHMLTEQPQTTEQPQITEQPQTSEKTMQLRIPLISPDLITQTIEENTLNTPRNESVSSTDENILTMTCSQTVPATDDNNDLVSEEVYQQILRELRQDPDLAQLMNDIELNTDEGDEDIDIDLPLEDDRLEQELYDFW